MLTEFLSDLGMHDKDSPLNLASLLVPFSDWIVNQEIGLDDRPYLASRIGAFICEFLIDLYSAERRIVDDRIYIQMQFSESILREFDPYAVAMSIAASESTLVDFLAAITKEASSST